MSLWSLAIILPIHLHLHSLESTFATIPTQLPHVSLRSRAQAYIPLHRWSRFWKLLLFYHWNHGKSSRHRTLRKSGYMCAESVDGSNCRKLMAESGEIWNNYATYRRDNVNIGDSDPARPLCFWMQLNIHRISIVVVNINNMNFSQTDCVPNNCEIVFKVSVNLVSTIYLIISAIKVLHSYIHWTRGNWPALNVNWYVTWSLPHVSNEWRLSVNDLWSCILDIRWAVKQDSVIIIVLAVWFGTQASEDIMSTSSQWALMQDEWFFLFHLA